MSREIKFRLYHKPLKKFLEPWEFCIDGRGCIYLLGQYKPDNSQERHLNASTACVEVNQYTGLTDKNGKEIYEGDIVKYAWKDNKPEIFAIEYMELQNCGDCFYDSGIGFNFYLKNPGEVEIIGNIQKNPELLNATD